MYVDGKKDGSAAGVDASVSLANEGDVYVGGTPEGRYLDGALDFLRIAQGTLADADTTIEELYAWEFDGPQMRDFTGRKPTGARERRRHCSSRRSRFVLGRVRGTEKRSVCRK